MKHMRTKPHAAFLLPTGTEPARRLTDDVSYDSCSECGAHPCRCDQEATGYECGDCGYVPTHRELQRGGCPGCAQDRRRARKVAENLTKAAAEEAS